MNQMPTVHEAGSGRPLIFLHGWTMDGGLFSGQFQLLADRFHCLAPDLPGHGSALGLPASLDNAAARLHALLDERDLRDAILVGWSMGAATAWRYVSLHGTNGLAALITVDMSPKLVNEDGWELGLIDQNRATIEANSARFRDDWAGSAGAIAAGMFADRVGPPGFRFDEAMAKIASADAAAMSRMWATLVAMDERATIARIGIPYLVMHGALSRVYSAATADWLVEQAPRARRHTFAASGHSPHLEEPDAFAQVVAEFAEGIVGRLRE